MDNSSALINLGDLSKPATILIEKISDAIGGIFRPYQIRRIAEAEAKADKIKALSQIDITELQRRAIQRFMIEEANKQLNIETITQKALPKVEENAAPENIENDWITNFFDKCRLISDSDMQNLWAKILAGEANTPGKYSKRTIDMLSSLDKNDAQLFSNLCSFAFNIGDLIPLIYDSKAKIYNNHRLNFNTLSHLSSIGLIQYDGIGGFSRRGLKQSGYVLYHDQRLWIKFDKPDDNEMNIGMARFTKVGSELALITDCMPVDGFVEYIKEQWKSFGYNIDQSPLTMSAPAH